MKIFLSLALGLAVLQVAGIFDVTVWIVAVLFLAWVCDRMRV